MDMRLVLLEMRLVVPDTSLILLETGLFVLEKRLSDHANGLLIQGLGAKRFPAALVVTEHQGTAGRLYQRTHRIQV